MIDNTTVHAITDIVSTPTICSGQPRINGTRMTVKFLSTFIESDWTIGEICENFDLTPSQIYAAFSYYYAHQEEIDQSLAEDRRLSEEHRADPEYQAHITKLKSKRHAE